MEVINMQLSNKTLEVGVLEIFGQYKSCKDIDLLDDDCTAVGSPRQM